MEKTSEGAFGLGSMRVELKNLLKEFIPPGLLRLRRTNVFTGDYRSWQDAAAAPEGYDTDRILEKVRHSLLKVKNGEALYERDSVLFDEVQYSWPLLSALLWIASCSGNRLHLIDFGGSLGSSYFQNRRFLSHLSEWSWSIVEQAKFVECGRREFEDGNLAFYSTIEECRAARPCNAVLLSSVLPYVERPHEWLDRIVSAGFEYIIIDRTPFLLKDERDRLTVQTVPKHIYKASYPAWFFGRADFLKHFEGRYEKVAEFDALSGAIRIGLSLAFDRGFIFKKERTCE
jgi:putative methyltransferase (TIGR04325 family)